jgi:hypothetical protein
MRKGLYLAVTALGLFPASNVLACSWDLNGVGYPASCGYRPPGGGGGRYVAPAPYVPPPPSPAQIAAQRAHAVNEAGVKAEKAGNLDLALSLYEQAVQLNPGDPVLANNLRHARAKVVNNQGLQAFNAGNWALALSLFEQAWRLLPGDRTYDRARATLRTSIQTARNKTEEQAGREKQQQQDRVAAGNMQKSIQDLAQSISAAPSPAGLNFSGTQPGNNNASPSGGLPFLASNPAVPDGSAHASNAAQPGVVVQTNPGAKLEPPAPVVKPVAAIEASSAKEQLFNSRFESTGRLFDNGQGPDDAELDPKLKEKLPDVATPSAQPLDPRLAKSQDYRTAAMDLAKAQIQAETLNRKMTDLEDQQKTSPSPERQIEISNLSAQVSQAKGALTIATNKLDAVKKKVIEEGPAIVVDDSAPASRDATPAPARQ